MLCKEETLPLIPKQATMHFLDPHKDRNVFAQCLKTSLAGVIK